MDSKTLKEIPMYKECIICNVVGEEQKKMRFLDLGFFAGSKVIPLYECHGGGTRVYSVKDTLIAIRSNDANLILAKEVQEHDCAK